MNKFQLDIITPTSIISYDNISYLRIPSLDGLTGIQAKHAASIIALTIGEIKITINGKNRYFSTSGGYSDIKPEGVQLLLETIEDTKTLDQERATKSLNRAQKRLDEKSIDMDRAQKSILRAKNRLNLFKKK